MTGQTTLYFEGQKEVYKWGDPKLDERMRDYRTSVVPWWVVEESHHKSCGYCGVTSETRRNTCMQCGAPA
jgi:hypothetical protein